ncbi:polyprenyl synthetase family protein [Oribacterium sp. C9]|uniref:polyprenyl synthetase family protein n=1 Tax=Oribacterium sp. C9 TaxID=1943579 RepID=UPI002E8E0ED6|nr:polyprenyl synthetase family protein [Oribacterium sp. C9]
MKMEFSHELEETVRSINEIIRKELPKVEGFQSTVMESITYSLEAGGKRIRPVLILKSYELYKDRYGSEWDAFMRPVLNSFICAMEMIHTASLCHDDLPCMDGDKYRRGRESTWYKYGEAMGTLCGDALLIYPTELTTRIFREQLTKLFSAGLQASAETFNAYTLSFVKALNILSEKSGVYGMLGGQVVDVEMTGKPLSDEQLMFIYKLKTGALLQASLMIGAVLGGATDAELEKMADVGEKIGVAFQIQDDILDETSTVEVLGKPIHSDDENHKTTYVSIYGLEDAHKEVERLSENAVLELQNLTEVNDDCRRFLIELTNMLINRKK